MADYTLNQVDEEAIAHATRRIMSLIEQVLRGRPATDWEIGAIIEEAIVDSRSSL